MDYYLDIKIYSSSKFSCSSSSVSNSSIDSMESNKSALCLPVESSNPAKSSGDLALTISLAIGDSVA
jgi:hypothetical protein